MVTTRSGVDTKKRQGGLSTVLLLTVSLGIVAVLGSAAFAVFHGLEHKAHSIFERSRYSFGGAEAQARKYWQDVPSWEDIKSQASASTGQVVPDPSIWQQTKSLFSSKSVRQIQAEDAAAAGKQWASNTADSISDTASSAYSSAESGYQSGKEGAAGLFSSARDTILGLGSKAKREAARQRHLNLEAQWRSEYNSQEGVLQKLKYILVGPYKAPSTQHYDRAHASGSKAYDHASKAAAELAEAAKHAAGGAAHAGRGAARSASGAAAGVKDIGSRSAESAKEAAGTASEYASDAASTAGEKAQAAYEAADQAARNAGQKVGDAVHGEL